MSPNTFRSSIRLLERRGYDWDVDGDEPDKMFCNLSLDEMKENSRITYTSEVESKLYKFCAKHRVSAHALPSDGNMTLRLMKTIGFDTTDVGAYMYAVHKIFTWISRHVSGKAMPGVLLEQRINPGERLVAWKTCWRRGARLYDYDYSVEGPSPDIVISEWESWIEHPYAKMSHLVAKAIRVKLSIEPIARMPTQLPPTQAQPTERSADTIGSNDDGDAATHGTRPTHTAKDKDNRQPTSRSRQSRKARQSLPIKEAPTEDVTYPDLPEDELQIRIPTRTEAERRIASLIEENEALKAELNGQQAGAPSKAQFSRASFGLTPRESVEPETNASSLAVAETSHSQPASLSPHDRLVEEVLYRSGALVKEVREHQRRQQQEREEQQEQHEERDDSSRLGQEHSSEGAESSEGIL